MNQLTRRQFLKGGVYTALAASATRLNPLLADSGDGESYIVGIARVSDGDIAYAVEEAIDLLGGMAQVTQGRDRIMLKPNLVGDSPHATTKLPVIRTLAELMKSAGKEVLIGEGSAAASPFNVRSGTTYRTRCADILEGMQRHVFDQLGYTDLAQSLKIPLVNLHCGEMATVPVPSGFVFDELSLPIALTEIDLLCSVPMMKTHVLATVTLGLKNLIGVYPGSIYYSVRSWLHDCAWQAGSPGIAYEIVDMARVNKMGLTVVDGSTAMEGDGPTGGTLVPMNLIIAGTNPLATDMVTASVMGFGPSNIPTLACAMEAGLGPQSLEQIEIRGAQVAEVRRRFVPPNVYSWPGVQPWGQPELYPAPKPRIRVNAQGEAVVTWDVPADGGPPVELSEKPDLQGRARWRPITPIEPGMHRVDTRSAPSMFFRFRRQQ
jgi:uncharacterized protein (DUF362 family)